MVVVEALFGIEWRGVLNFLCAYFCGCCAGAEAAGAAAGEPAGAPAGAAGFADGADEVEFGADEPGADDAGAETRAVFTEAGSLSALASSSDTCHICVSLSDLLNPGMPVRRKPLAIFQ